MNNIKNITKLPLDNAAKIYPAAMNKRWNSVFAVSAHLNEDVNILALKKAVEDLYVRFPSFYVVLKKGFFWDYFVPCTDTDIVEKEAHSPCRSFDVSDKRKPLFRVVYSKREIRCEFFHSVTDGTGGNEYLKALLYQYFINCRKNVYSDGKIRTLKEGWSNSEISDDFHKSYVKGLKCSRSDTNAYQVKLKKEKDFLSRTQICMPIDEIAYISKHIYNCTVTQLVSGVYAMALIEEYKKSKSNKPVKLSIPVNLRKFYGSDTLRNFSSYVTVDVMPSCNYSLESVIDMIKMQMAQKITKENFTAMISQNISDEEMAISKYSPNIIKRLVMKAAFYMYGEAKYTSTVTNTGYIKLPESMENLIDYFAVTLGATAVNKINCAVSGFKNTLCVTLTSVSRDMQIQNDFMRILDDMNVNYKISAHCNKTEANAFAG
ncbi:MAG: hypothetical protein ACI4IE_09535 [Eubacterium sp.]